MRTRTHMGARPRTHVHTHTYTHAHTHAHTHTHTHSQTHTHIHTHTLSHTLPNHALVRAHTHTRTHAHTRTHTHTHAHGAPQVEVRTWDAALECVAPLRGADEAGRYAEGARRFDFDAHLAPYNLHGLPAWQALSSHITQGHVARIPPVGGNISIMAEAVDEVGGRGAFAVRAGRGGRV